MWAPRKSQNLICNARHHNSMVTVMHLSMLCPWEGGLDKGWGFDIFLIQISLLKSTPWRQNLLPKDIKIPTLGGANL